MTNESAIGLIIDKGGVFVSGTESEGEGTAFSFSNTGAGGSTLSRGISGVVSITGENGTGTGENGTGSTVSYVTC